MTEDSRFLPYFNEPLDLPSEDQRFPPRHIFDDEDVDAVNAALAAGRPLLLRGRPGTGKSQLARAAAFGLKRAFVSEVIDARTESRDLLWRFDAVRRLADAQVGSEERLAKRCECLAQLLARAGEKSDEIDGLDERFYTAPGSLWWAFDWSRAKIQAEIARAAVPPQRSACDREHGVVVLLDEMDKADSSVPNGLLGVLGDGTFSVPGYGEVKCHGVAPLVVITTNEERSLPDAFLRRCAVHHLDRDQNDEKLRLWLERLGDAHFGAHLPGSVQRQAAQMVLDDRADCIDADVSPPGGAEYLDLLRAVAERIADREEPPEMAAGYLETARRFLIRKHPA